MSDESVYLKHIRDAIARIEMYTVDGRERFFRDPMVQDAVIRNLEIIGEAVSHLSLDFRQQHPEIPWRSIRALRNVLVTNTLAWIWKLCGGSFKNGFRRSSVMLKHFFPNRL
jgi:uncharacterized protein with HEPN domain